MSNFELERSPGLPWLRVVACGLLLAGASHAQVSLLAAAPVPLPQVSALATGAGTRLWTYTNPPEGWIAWVVSLGNNGTEAFSQFGPLSDYTRMVSGYAPDPATPAWQFQDAFTTQRHCVDSAEDVDVHVSLYDRPETGAPGLRRVVLRKYRRTQSNGDWSYDWPILSNGHDALWTRVSRDGQTIAASVYNMNTGLQDIAIFGPNSNVPLRTFHFDCFGVPKTFELSADGRVAATPSGAKLQLFDTTTGAVLYSTYLFSQTFQGHALSADGSVYAYGGNNAATIVKRSATSGQYGVAFTHTLPGACFCPRLDVSDNGQTLGVAFNYTDNWNKVVLQALDLSTFTTTMSETVIGSGNLQNICSAVSTSGDGSIVAFGLWGDQNGLSPEVRVYRRDQSTPLWTYDLPGSVNAIDLSSDGRRLSVASKGVHANTTGGGGRIDLFQVGDEDLAVNGSPAAGTTINVTARGAPGKPAILLSAPSLAVQPIVFPTLGTLYLSRTALMTTPMGNFDASGNATVGFMLPSSPGTTLYLQGYSSSPRRLGTTYLKVTTLP